MSPIDSLPPEQRAVLSLVLQKGRSYTEIAALLKIDAEHVRDRAQSALDALAPRDGEPLPAARRHEVGDYLLGQQSSADAERTHSMLAESAAARAWARGVAGELRPLSRIELPQIPAEDGGPRAAEPVAAPTPAAEPAPGAEPAPAAGAVKPPPPPRVPPTSRRGGAILLGGLAAIAAVIVLAVLLQGGGGGQSKTLPATSGQSGSTGKTQLLAQINLVPPSARSRAVGLAWISQQGQTQTLTLAATGLRPSGTSRVPAYAVWLYNSHHDAQRLGFAGPVKTDGKLGALAPMPSNANRYRSLIITIEYSGRSTTPGPIVLAGALPGHTIR